jgi:CheY-like chemotaxis protein
VFGNAGYHVETARNGREGLALARAGAFEAIITDMIMPELDGRGMIARLRADGNEVPIVAITAYTPYEINLDAADTQCIDQLIRKPFTAHQIRNAVEGAILSAAHREKQEIPAAESFGMPFRNQGL